MNIAIIGAGWAGLSAAIYLHRQGHAVTVFETAHTLGGRARRVHSPRLNATIDNGQHILLGAYTETLSLMTSLGLSLDAVLHRQPLLLQTARGQFSLKVPDLPAPLHLLAAILGARGLSIADKLRFIAINRRLQRQQWKVLPALTVAQWLNEGKQSRRAIQYFWEPLCLAALNTPTEHACAQLLANVLRDSLGGAASDCAVLIPRVDLTSLWPEHLPAGIKIHFGQAVRRLTSHERYIDLDGFKFDAAVVAANGPSTLRLLQTLPPSQDSIAYLSSLAAFEYLPIATVTLMLEKPWNLPCPMLMLDEVPGRQQFGQWLFDRNTFMDQPARNGGQLTVVISNAVQLGEHAHDTIIAGIIAQLQEQTTRFAPMPNVVGHELIVEKRATFAALPALRRPDNKTPWPRIWTAGDWTDTGYPGVLEGAVRSGRRAARLIGQAT